MMEDHYKTYCLDIAGQMVVCETSKMVALVTLLEQWIWRLKKTWKRKRQKVYQD